MGLIVKYLILHTAAFRGEADIQLVRRWHTAPVSEGGRGWSDVGYHFFIRRDGTIETGRPVDIIGAHCRDLGMNYVSLGICFEGHGDYEEWKQAQWASFTSLAQELCNEYHVPAKNIWGHRETGAPKTCPGNMIDMTRVRRVMEVIMNPKRLTYR